jgi:hypothetical protein
VQWPSRFVVCSIVELSVKLKSVLTQCACKRLRINLEFFSEPSKKRRKNRDYIELAYSQLKQLTKVGSGIFLQIYVGNFWVRCAQPLWWHGAVPRHGHGPGCVGERQRGVQRAGNAFDGHLAYLPTHLSRSLTMVFMALVTLLPAQRLVIEFEYLAFIATYID